MKILLISANTEQINMPVMPLGMACVAIAVEKAGHEVKTLNLMTPEDISSLLEETIQTFDPEVIGVSVRNIDDQALKDTRCLIDSAKEVVDRCRQLSKAFIVLGGAGYSIFPDSALAYLNADAGVKGEGEFVFIELLNRLSQKQPLKEIPGLYLPQHSTESPLHTEKNLDRFDLPLPDLNLTAHPGFNPKDIWLPFQTRRGCPMNCSYCSTAAIEGRILRKRSIKKAVESLGKYADEGIEQFFIVDNTFNLPISYAKAFCDRIIETGLNIRWQAIIYPNYVDEELVQKMAKAGCVNVAFGFESSSSKILKMMNKKYTPETVKSISRLFKKHRVGQMGFLMLGGPGETKESVEKSLAFANALDLELMKVTVGIRIYPHTELARIAVEKKVISPDDDLLFPRFYLEDSLKEWLPIYIEKWIEDRSNWTM
jgi:radical SAM superfamily enzyme YgiQ (UPF0313 family)